jgi:hypothetical protein
MQTDGQTDMTKLMVALDKFANAPKVYVINAVLCLPVIRIYSIFHRNLHALPYEPSIPRKILLKTFLESVVSNSAASSICLM